MTGRRGIVAWGLAAGTLALGAGTVVFALVAVEGQSSSETSFIVAQCVLPIVGALVASRHPGNPIGWICLAIGLLFVLLSVQDVLARWAYEQGDADLAGWVAAPALWVPALGLMGTHLALLLPTGTPISPGWRGFARLCTGTLAVTFLVATLEPGGSGVDLPGLENPLAGSWSSSLTFLYVLLPVCILGSVASLAVRYRRSAGIERIQLRWIALGGCSAIALFALATSLGQAWLYLAAFAAIPTAIGIAILRYRLYDIDVVINRTLVYGALTATLAAVYLGSVLLLQLALGGLTSDSNLAIAGSTLAVAALFRPARRRIQELVDRRFYRRRYDAQRTLDSFSSRLRDQVDLAALDAELRGVVAETMQPAHVSVWLKGGW